MRISATLICVLLLPSVCVAVFPIIQLPRYKILLFFTFYQCYVAMAFIWMTVRLTLHRRVSALSKIITFILYIYMCVCLFLLFSFQMLFACILKYMDFSFVLMCMYMYCKRRCSHNRRRSISELLTQITIVEMIDRSCNKRSKR